MLHSEEHHSLCHSIQWSESPPPRIVVNSRCQLQASKGLFFDGMACWLPPATCRTVTLLQTGEGAGFDVETVLMPVMRSQGRRPRTTLCISSQVGCAMNCQFCFTGRMGLK